MYCSLSEGSDVVDINEGCPRRGPIPTNLSIMKAVAAASNISSLDRGGGVPSSGVQQVNNHNNNHNNNNSSSGSSGSNNDMMARNNHVLYNYMGQHMMIQPTNPSTTNHTRDDDPHHHAGSTLVSYSNSFMKPNLLYGQSSETYLHTTQNNNTNTNTNNSGTANNIHSAGNWMVNLPQQSSAYNHPTTKPNMFAPAWNHHNLHD